ncbi:MAG: ATP-binding cassette domain-containing protein [Candidatus Cloacimonadota bacterium]|nr:ATP-binding cassette domain-containing protein [Candidatus Cloacimonadota bacterium]
MIQIENLCKSFNKRKILNGFNLTIEKGQTTVILGESGCGKTIFLKHLIGLLQPDSGEIFFDGQRMNGLSRKDFSAMRKRITLVFQQSALFDWLSVYDNIALPLAEQKNISGKKIHTEVTKYLKIVGLTGEENKMPEELSIGMQKRVSIARALIFNPEYILFDEPTTGLDPIIAHNILRLFEKLKKLNTTILIVSHDIGVVFKIADKVAMMKDGKIVFEGSVADFENSSETYLKKFQVR